MSSYLKDDTIYGFINWDNKKVIDLTGGSGAPGTGVIGFHGHYDTPYSTGNNQYWIIRSLNDPQRAAFHNIVNAQTGTYLDTKTGSNGEVTVVCNPQDKSSKSQTWSFITFSQNNATPSFMFSNGANPGNVITVKGGNSADGTPLVLVTASFESGGEGQQEGWQKFVAVPIGAAAPPK